MEYLRFEHERVLADLFSTHDTHSGEDDWPDTVSTNIAVADSDDSYKLHTHWDENGELEHLVV